MKAEELLERAREALTGRRVFGEPVQQGGLTVLPAAAVIGAGGGGGGRDDEGQEGMGGGFGLRARPVGVYVIKGDEVTWRPSLDVNRLASTLAIVVLGVLFHHWRVTALRARVAGADS